MGKGDLNLGLVPISYMHLPLGYALVCVVLFFSLLQFGSLEYQLEDDYGESTELFLIAHVTLSLSCFVLQGICDDMKLEFYLVAYDGIGISCRRIGDLSERLSSSTPVFWTTNPAFIESPLSPEEDYLYNSRIHLQLPVTSKDIHWQCPLIDNEVVCRIMYINSSYDLVIPGLAGTSANPWRVEGRIWQYKNGTFGFGFLRDNYIVDLRHIAQNGYLLDTMELCSD